MVTIISQLASTIWESTQLTLGRDAAEPVRAVCGLTGAWLPTESFLLAQNINRVIFLKKMDSIG